MPVIDGTAAVRVSLMLVMAFIGLGGFYAATRRRSNFASSVGGGLAGAIIAIAIIYVLRWGGGLPWVN